MNIDDWGVFPVMQIDTDEEIDKEMRLAIHICIHIHEMLDIMARRNDKIKRTPHEAIEYLNKLAPQVFNEEHEAILLEIYDRVKDFNAGGVDAEKAKSDPCMQLAIHVGMAINKMHALMLLGSMRQGFLKMKEETEAEK